MYFNQLPVTFDQGLQHWLNTPEPNQNYPKPLLLFFWSVSCQLCKESMPDFLKLAASLEHIDILLIHVPRSAHDLDSEPLVQYRNDKSIEFPIYLDNRHQFKNFYRVTKLPAYVLLDKRGRIRYKQPGGKQTNMLLQHISHIQYD